MTSTWICLWAKHMPFFHTRLFSSTANVFQCRGYVLPGDAACLLPEDDLNTIFRSGAKSQIDVALQTCGSLEQPSDVVERSSKSDLLSSLCGPISARNQELVNSLRKIIQPVAYEDDIHVSKSDGKATYQLQELCNKTNIDHTSTSTFHSREEPSVNDLLLMKTHDMPVSTKSEGNLNCSSQDSGDTSADNDKNRDKRTGPTFRQLEHIQNYYLQIVPIFMRKGERLNWDNHDRDIIFENHLRKKCKTTVGIMRYAFEISNIRLYAAFWYPLCRLQIKSITIHQEQGYLKIHWSAKYTTRKQLMSFLRSFIKSYMEDRGPDYGEFEAISTIYVNKTGRVYKHVVDRRIRIDDENVSPIKNFAAKTVGMVGLSTNASSHTSKEAIP